MSMRVNAVTKMPNRIPIGILRRINDQEGWGISSYQITGWSLTLGKIDFSLLFLLLLDNRKCPDYYPSLLEVSWQVVNCFAPRVSFIVSIQNSVCSYWSSVWQPKTTGIKQASHTEYWPFFYTFSTCNSVYILWPSVEFLIIQVPSVIGGSKT